jgi:integral membrane sensor domain MASE1
LSATIGVTGLVLSGVTDAANFHYIWLTCWLGSGVGQLIVTPVVILWRSRRTRHWQARKSVEASFVLLVLILVGQAVFGNWFHLGFMIYPIAFLCTTILIWTAFRFGQWEIAVYNFALSVIALGGTLHGYGPFARPTELESILLLQVFLGITTIMCISISSLISERSYLMHELRDSLAHVRTLSALLPMCSWCKKIRDDRGYWQEVEAYIYEHSDVAFSHGVCPDCFSKYKSEALERRGRLPSNGD